MMKGMELHDKKLEEAFVGITNAHYCTLRDIAQFAVCHRKSLLDAWKAIANNTSIFINNLGMKGILNHILVKGNDQVQLSYLEYEIGLRKEAHEKMLRELKQQVNEEAAGSEEACTLGKFNRRDQLGGPFKKNRPSSSSRK